MKNDSESVFNIKPVWNYCCISPNVQQVNYTITTRCFSSIYRFLFLLNINNWFRIKIYRITVNTDWYRMCITMYKYFFNISQVIHYSLWAMKATNTKYLILPTLGNIGLYTRPQTVHWQAWVYNIHQAVDATLAGMCVQYKVRTPSTESYIDYKLLLSLTR